MYYVGIDIGGMSIKFGLVDEEGAIIYKTVLSVDYNEVSIEKTISLMKDKIEELCTGAKIHLKDIKGIGIGCPGVCNTDEGILVNAPNLKWQDVHIREMFADLRIPTFICNDANVALIGEATFGAGKGFKDLLLLTLGTGVGGGIIIDGKLFEGVGYMGGELGHMIIEMDGRECGCGHKGCLEAYASVSALIKDTKEEMLKNKKSKMWDACLGDINQVAPFNTVDEVVNHIRKVIKDKDIKIETFNISKTYDECSFKNEGYRLIKETTIETYPNTIVSPFIMLGGTDARHYNEISSCVIRFSPIKVTNEDRKGIHGLNEKIKVETLIKCEEFYERLLLKL